MGAFVDHGLRDELLKQNRALWEMDPNQTDLASRVIPDAVDNLIFRLMASSSPEHRSEADTW
jgi:hypothetical protein